MDAASTSGSIDRAAVERGAPPRTSQAWLLACVALALGASRYYPFIADDALISLRYARRLLDGRGLTWDDYHPVEGYSNLLWTLTTAALGVTGVPLVAAARMTCALSAVVCLWTFCAAARRFEPKPGLDHAAAWLACGFFALSGGVQVWSIGGLEQTQLAALLLLSITTHLRFHASGDIRWLRASALLHALLIFTRPDSVLFAAGSVVAAAWLPPPGAQGSSQRLAAWRWLLGATLTGLALKHLFSHTYYGEWLPNTAYVKLALTWTRIQSGVEYLKQFAIYSAYLAVCLFVFMYIRRARLQVRALAYLAFDAGLWSAYVVLIGGDIFPADRHGLCLTALACLAFVVADGNAGPHRPNVWLVCVAIAALTGHTYVQAEYSQNQRAIHERWEFPCANFAKHLGRTFRRQEPTLAIYASGCMAYYSDLPAIDMHGLSDWTIARNRPRDLGQGRIGHEFGRTRSDADYLWRRNPALIVHHIGVRLKPFYSKFAGARVGRRLAARYRDIEFAHGDERFWALISRDGVLTKPTLRGQTLEFPGVALEPVMGDVPSLARLEVTGAAYVLTDASSLCSADITSGRYQLHADLAGGQVETECNGSKSATIVVGADGFCCTIRPAHPGEPAMVKSLRFTPAQNVSQ